VFEFGLMPAVAGVILICQRKQPGLRVRFSVLIEVPMCIDELPHSDDLRPVLARGAGQPAKRERLGHAQLRVLRAAILVATEEQHPAFRLQPKMELVGKQILSQRVS